MTRLKDKIAIITGAGGGIGASTTKLFDAEGAVVIASDLDLPKVEAVVTALQNANPVKTDVTQENEVRELIQSTVTQYGRLDIMINNAGIGPTAMNKTAEHSKEDWDAVVAVNQTGVFYGMKYALKQMASQESGTIVNVASLAGLKAAGNMISYTASKFAVVGMTKSAALEYASRNIRINAVCPGYTHSDLLDQLLNTQPNMEEILKSYIPMKRFGQANEIAEAIAWLSSDQTGFITGQTITLDGGTSL